MKPWALELLACPDCGGELQSVVGDRDEQVLRCQSCAREFPIVRGVPRFVAADNYAETFGYQWNLFRETQLDSRNGTTISADRLFGETGWTEDWLRDRTILDVGCGAGRFLDVLAREGCRVVGIDFSDAADAAAINLAGHDNVQVIQADLRGLPFRRSSFDGCYCLGVLQHTPDPLGAVDSLTQVLKPSAPLALTVYERKPWTLLHTKYWIRPFTKRLGSERLLRLITMIMPIAFPLTEALFRLPFFGRLFRFLIPIANPVRLDQLSRRQRYEWTVLDTLDMLSPAYDQPMTAHELRFALARTGILQVRRRQQPGLNLVGLRKRPDR